MNRTYLPFLLCYAGLIIYASLFPFTGWCLPQNDLFSWLVLKLPESLSKSDLIVNVLAYIPLGFLLVKLFLVDTRWFIPLYLAILIGCGLSFSMESLQAFLPTRVSSILDLTTNSAGTLLGSLFALTFHPSTATALRVTKWRDQHLLPGKLSEVALAVIICWALSQVAPFFPSVDFGDIKNAIKPLWFTIRDLSRFDGIKAAEYACDLAGLGLVALTAARDKSRLRLALTFVVFAAAVLCSKMFFTGRQLSLESLAGLGLGSLIALLLVRLPRAWRCYAGILLILTGFVIMETKAGAPGGTMPPFDWIPFRSLMNNEMGGFEMILEGIWPFAGMSYLSLVLLDERRTKTIIIGGVAVFMLVLALEWNQLTIPGRTADITQAIIAAAGWFSPLVFCRRSHAKVQSAEDSLKLTTSY